MSAEKKTDEEIIAAIRVHKTITAAAAALGCAETVIYERRKKSVAISEAIMEARGRLVDKAEASVERLIDQDDFRAVNLVLRTLGKDRGYVERVETVEITDEMLDKAIAKEREKLGEEPSGESP